MRLLTFFLLLLLISPAYGQLTKDELRTILKEEIAASEKRTKEYIDLKVESINARIDGLDQRIDDVEKNLNTRIDDVEKNLNDKIGALDKSLNARMNDMQIMMVALVGLIAAAIALPQLIVVYKEKRGQKEMQAQIDRLHEKLSVLESPPS